MKVTTVCSWIVIASCLGYLTATWRYEGNLALLRDVTRRQLELTRQQTELLSRLIEAQDGEHIEQWQGSI